jgi:phenylalanyl-tRNA synthetase beta chain
MKTTFNWLKQYVDFSWPPEQLTERLTMLGLEVERVEKLGGEFEGVVVAQILASEKHPNADKLSVCKVADGQGERQIVCGAKNYKVGDKVPLILPGRTLPAKPGETPLTIKVGKIRGVESHGMLCSPTELGLADDAAGLMILPPETKVGQAFAEYLGRPTGDVVYDLEITPNRPDLNSVIGIAREISALTGNPLRIPQLDVKPIEAAGTANSVSNPLVNVRLDDPVLCPRYVARVIQGAKIGPSPDWLKSMLEKVGIRSINNVVDVTNYVMLEVGQPLHAFDYHLLTPATGAQTPTIVVRRAADGDKFTTLDGQERLLTNQMLLIADETKAIALAGVMGGANTEINNQTRDVLLESAYFKPQNIRATSKRLDLRTESSYRFERGADLGITDWASRRAAQLILQTAGGQLAPAAVDAYPQPPRPVEVTLRHVKARELLGIEIPVRQQIESLKRLGLDLVGAEHGAFNTFRVPSFRVDLKREVDLIEEVARLYGVDHIPASAPRGAIGTNAHDQVHDDLAEARRILAGVGLFEAQGQTLISKAHAVASTDAKATAEVEVVPLANPLSSDMDVLRPTLLAGLLEALSRNLHHKNEDVTLFEIGRVFQQSQGRTVEQRRLGIALTGRRNPPFWKGDDRDAKFDLYDLKGLLEEFFEQFGIRGLSYRGRSASTSLFLESAEVVTGQQVLGEFGQVLPTLARQHDLKDAVLLAELNLDLLLSRRNPAKSFKPLPLFPPIRRDVAMLLPDAAAHEAVLSAVKQARPPHLESVDLFDVYRGQNVPPGQKSVAYAFTYRSPERTLTDAEVNAAHQQLVEQLKRELHAVIRE